MGDEAGPRWFGGAGTVLGGSFARGDAPRRRGAEWTAFAAAVQRAHAAGEAGETVQLVLGGARPDEVARLALGDVVQLCPLRAEEEGEWGAPSPRAPSATLSASSSRGPSPVPGLGSAAGQAGAAGWRPAGPGPGPPRAPGRDEPREGDALALPAMRALGWMLAAASAGGALEGDAGVAAEAVAVILDLVRGRRRCREVVTAMACWCLSSHGLSHGFVEAWAERMVAALAAALVRTGAPHTDALTALVRLYRDVPDVVRAAAMVRLWAGPVLSRALAERSPGRFVELATGLLTGAARPWGTPRERLGVGRAVSDALAALSANPAHSGRALDAARDANEGFWAVGMKPEEAALAAVDLVSSVPYLLGPEGLFGLDEGREDAGAEVGTKRGPPPSRTCGRRRTAARVAGTVRGGEKGLGQRRRAGAGGDREKDGEDVEEDGEEGFVGAVGEGSGARWAMGPNHLTAHELLGAISRFVSLRSGLRVRERAHRHALPALFIALLQSAGCSREGVAGESDQLGGPLPEDLAVHCTKALEVEAPASPVAEAALAGLCSMLEACCIAQPLVPFAGAWARGCLEAGAFPVLAPPTKAWERGGGEPAARRSVSVLKALAQFVRGLDVSQVAGGTPVCLPPEAAVALVSRLVEAVGGCALATGPTARPLGEAMRDTARSAFRVLLEYDVHSGVDWAKTSLQSASAALGNALNAGQNVGPGLDLLAQLQGMYYAECPAHALNFDGREGSSAQTSSLLQAWVCAFEVAAHHFIQRCAGGAVDVDGMGHPLVEWASQARALVRRIGGPTHVQSVGGRSAAMSLVACGNDFVAVSDRLRASFPEARRFEIGGVLLTAWAATAASLAALLRDDPAALPLSRELASGVGDARTHARATEDVERLSEFFAGPLRMHDSLEGSAFAEISAVLESWASTAGKDDEAVGRHARKEQPPPKSPVQAALVPELGIGSTTPLTTEDMLFLSPLRHNEPPLSISPLHAAGLADVARGPPHTPLRTPPRRGKASSFAAKKDDPMLLPSRQELASSGGLFPWQVKADEGAKRKGGLTAVWAWVDAWRAVATATVLNDLPIPNRVHEALCQTILGFKALNTPCTSSRGFARVWLLSCADAMTETLTLSPLVNQVRHMRESLGRGAIKRLQSETDAGALKALARVIGGLLTTLASEQEWAVVLDPKAMFEAADRASDHAEVSLATLGEADFVAAANCLDAGNILCQRAREAHPDDAVAVLGGVANGAAVWLCLSNLAGARAADKDLALAVDTCCERGKELFERSCGMLSRCAPKDGWGSNPTARDALLAAAGKWLCVGIFGAWSATVGGRAQSALLVIQALAIEAWITACPPLSSGVTVPPVLVPALRALQDGLEKRILPQDFEVCEGSSFQAAMGGVTVAAAVAAGHTRMGLLSGKPPAVTYATPKLRQGTLDKFAIPSPPLHAPEVSLRAPDSPAGSGSTQGTQGTQSRRRLAFSTTHRADEACENTSPLLPVAEKSVKKAEAAKSSDGNANLSDRPSPGKEGNMSPGSEACSLDDLCGGHVDDLGGADPVEQCGEGRNADVVVAAAAQLDARPWVSADTNVVQGPAPPVLAELTLKQGLQGPCSEPPGPAAPPVLKLGRTGSILKLAASTSPSGSDGSDGSARKKRVRFDPAVVAMSEDQDGEVTPTSGAGAGAAGLGGTPKPTIGHEWGTRPAVLSNRGGGPLSRRSRLLTGAGAAGTSEAAAQAAAQRARDTELELLDSLVTSPTLGASGASAGSPETGRTSLSGRRVGLPRPTAPGDRPSPLCPMLGWCETKIETLLGELLGAAALPNASSKGLKLMLAARGIRTIAHLAMLTEHEAKALSFATPQLTHLLNDYSAAHSPPKRAAEIGSEKTPMGGQKGAEISAAGPNRSSWGGKGSLQPPGAAEGGDDGIGEGSAPDDVATPSPRRKADADIPSARSSEVGPKRPGPSMSPASIVCTLRDVARHMASMADVDEENALWLSVDHMDLFDIQRSLAEIGGFLARVNNVRKAQAEVPDRTLMPS